MVVQLTRFSLQTLPLFGGGGNLLGVGIRLRDGWTEVRIPGLVCIFSYPINASIGPEAQPAATSLGTGLASREKAAGE
jgi:hypothetical protein